MHEDKEERIVNTSVRIAASLLKRVKHVCVDRGTNQTEAIIDGLQLWLALDKESAPAKPLDEHSPGSDMMSVAGLSKRHRRYLKTIAEGLRNKDVGVIGAAETAARMCEQSQALISRESDAQEETAEKGRRVAGTRG